MQNVTQVNKEPENGASDMEWNLKVRIANLNVSHKEFARRAGISPTHFSAIINGKKPKLLEQAQRIAREAHCTVDDLWPYEEDKHV